MPTVNWLNNVAAPAITPPQNPPNKRQPARCIMKEVDPLAATLRSVWRLSSTKATKINVERAHQPGKVLEEAQPDVSARIALALVSTTRTVVLLWRDMLS